MPGWPDLHGKLEMTHFPCAIHKLLVSPPFGHFAASTGLPTCLHDALCLLALFIGNLIRYQLKK